ncbi:MAG TPA: hypothetical protein VGK63_03940 [Candidatus Limnocylindrales bacterium]
MTVVGPGAMPPDTRPSGVDADREARPRPRSAGALRPLARDLSLPSVSVGTADRQLALLVVAATAAARLTGPPGAWLVAGLIAASAFVGALGIVAVAPGSRVQSRVGPAAGVVPAAIAAAGGLAIHAVAPGMELLLALAVIGLLVAWSVGLERRLVLGARAPSDEDVAMVLALSVAAAFVAFVGVGTLVEGGLARSGDSPIPVDRLVILAIADGLVAAALGVRLARLRAATARNATLAGLSSGAFVALSAGALRALAIPFLLGPALLALVFFLWDAVTGSTVARRRSPRWAWELGLLAILGVAVALLNLRVA